MRNEDFLCRFAAKLGMRATRSAAVVLSCSSMFTAGCSGSDGNAAAPNQELGSGGSVSSGGASTVTGGASGSGASASGGMGGALPGTGGGGTSGASSGGTAAGGSGGASGSGGSAGMASGGMVGSTGGQPNTMCMPASAAWISSLKSCQTDADCEIVPTYSCCGPGTIYGLAKSAAPMFAGCFQMSPPSGCPPLGCASEGRTEDEQPVQGADTGDFSTVLARCVDTASGSKECTTTVRGTCVDGATRCSAGDTCTNDCGEPCTCQSGYEKCTRPTGACPMPPKQCTYALPSGSGISSCSCTATMTTWACN